MGVAEDESDLIRNIQFKSNVCIINTHSLFGITFILHLLKLSAGKGYLFNPCLFYPRFTDKSTRGTNLFASVVHEVGHALGMRHSEKKSSVMYRLSKKYTGKDITLDAEDIKRIRKLYRIHRTDRANAKCKDKNSGMCAAYKEHGYCSPDYKDVMEQNCPWSCGYCDS